MRLNKKLYVTAAVCAFLASGTANAQMATPLTNPLAGTGGIGEVLGGLFGGGQKATENTQMMNNAELIKVVLNQMKELEAMMLTLERLGDTITPELADSLGVIRDAVRSQRRIIYDIGRAGTEYNRVYGDADVPLSRDVHAGRYTEQLVTAIDAGHASRDTAAAVVTDLDNYDARLERILAMPVVGTTSAVEQNTQTMAVVAQNLSSQTALLAAHQKVLEEDVNRQMSDELNSRHVKEHMWRDQNRPWAW